MEFNIAKVLVSALGYKGLPYPGVWFPSGKITGKEPEYQYEGQAKDVRTHSDLGSVLRKQDAQGRYYFMPVVLEHKGKEYEIPNSVKSVFRELYNQMISLKRNWLNSTNYIISMNPSY